MSIRVNTAAVRVYDALKERPGACPRESDARDKVTLGDIERRLRELIASYRLGGHEGPGNVTYVFWSEISGVVNAGAFDDLLDRL